jgi:hypothetical protein
MTQFLVLSVALGFDRYFLLFESPSGKAWALITKVNDVTHRWSDRSSDSISMLMSVFLVISVIAVSSAL